VAKLASLVVKLGALVFILFIPTQFALYLQLLGGVWIVQTFPSVVCGLFYKGLRAPALLTGWAVGMLAGTALAFADGIKPVHAFVLGGHSFAVYTGLFALLLNFVAVLAVQAMLSVGHHAAPHAHA